MVVKDKPKVEPQVARDVVHEHFNLNLSLESFKEINSYEDMNYMACSNSEGGEKKWFVVKFHNEVDSTEGLEALKAQEEALNIVQNVFVPKQIVGPGKLVELDGHKYLLRLFEFIPGKLLAEADQSSEKLLLEFGRTLGQLDLELEHLKHPGLNRHLVWDLKNARETIISCQAAFKEDNQQKKMVQAVLDILGEQSFLSSADQFRMSPIHCDANDHNVVVDAFHQSGSIALIDFGDLALTWTVAEIAIAITYIMIAAQDGQEKLRRASIVLQGYQSINPLTPVELEFLPTLIMARLATSVSLSSWEATRHPENQDYTSVHAKGAWETLAFMLEKRGNPNLFRQGQARSNLSEIGGAT